MWETTKHAMGFWQTNLLCVITDVIPQFEKYDIDAHHSYLLVYNVYNQWHVFFVNSFKHFASPR